MRYVVTGAQMKQIDQDTIQRIGIPSVVLMERAALAVAEEAKNLLSNRRDLAISGQISWSAAENSGILAVCGMGNNGADGIAAARILKGWGYRVKILLWGNPEQATQENRLQQKIAEKLQIPMVWEGQKGEALWKQEMEEGRWPVVIDGIFGIGLSRPVEGSGFRLLEYLQEKKQVGKIQVTAVDIPSGIHSATGAVMGTALAADITVTFGFEKTGLLLYPGKGFAGQVRTADIGFTEDSLEYSGWDGLVPETSELERLRNRQADGNKGTFGRVLIVAGSRGMCGAAYLSGLAAYRTGAGLVKLLTVPENREILQNQLPEAIVETYDPEELSLEEGKLFLEKQCRWADVIVLGPGLGREPYVCDLVEQILADAFVPIVLDADGLNTVASHPYLTRYFTENIIITPHMGEMARLCSCSVEQLKEDPVQAARSYSSRYGVVCVMKDAATVTADKDGNVWLNPSGCSAMAKAGSGDVLTGVIAGLLARGLECTDAAFLGVYVHGLAGEEAARRWGIHSVLAGNLADCILCHREMRSMT